jgi:O-methyltransferase
VKKNLGDLEKVVIKKGIFPQTTKGLENEIFSFVYIDVDLYKSTLEGINFFYPRMSKGGYIIVHDYNNPLESNSGVFRAIEDFMEDKKEKIIELPDYLGSIIFRKI